MCGIIYAKNLIGDHPVNNLVKILYQNQRDRGQQGFGFVGLSAKRIGTYRATDEEGIMKYLGQFQYDEIIFHHRFPTSSQNTLKSTHPFVIDMGDRRYYFVHNGVIENADELKEKHSRKGIRYSSEEATGFNDSEALAWEFCLWLNDKQQKVEAQGSAAFVCLAVDKNTNRAKKLYFYRNDGAPLKIYKDKTLLLLASEGNYPLIQENWLCFWDYQKAQLGKYKPLDIQRPSLFSFNGYDYCDFDDESEAEYAIASLEQERDYLLSIGSYVEAEEIDGEIERLRNQLRVMKRQQVEG